MDFPRPRCVYDLYRLSFADYPAYQGGFLHPAARRRDKRHAGSGGIPDRAGAFAADYFHRMDPIPAGSGHLSIGSMRRLRVPGDCADEKAQSGSSGITQGMKISISDNKTLSEMRLS